MSHLKHDSSGNLIHGPSGNLAHGCGSGGGTTCACGSLPACGNCADATPSQFHVTFTGVTLCTNCVVCEALGISVQLAGGSTMSGTYLLTHNGACAWTAFSPDVPASASGYESTDCSGSPAPLSFAIEQTRISATQFRLQIADDSNTILIFDAIVTAAQCCAGYTVDNGLSACGCGSNGARVNVGSGGTATVTPC